MFYAINWFVVVSLLMLWSLAAWAFHALAAWTVASAGTLTGAPGAIEALRMPVWLSAWVPPEFAVALNSLMAAIGPSIETAVQWAPAMSGGLSIAVWTLWGIGSVLLILLGLFATGLIAVMRRRQDASANFSRSVAAER